MKLDWTFGLAATAFACAWCANAFAQVDSTAAPAASSGIIHLHMPVHASGGTIHLHPVRRQDANPAEADTTGTAHAATAEARPAPSSPIASRNAKGAHTGTGSATIPFSFGEDGTALPAASGAAPPVSAPSEKTASLPPHAAAPAHPITSPKATDDDHAGLTKRGAVLFGKGAADPSPAQFAGVKLLAGDLTTALESGASRVQLEAYGGAPGDKSSDARRISLKRALAVRQLLIDNGVPSNRIDVRAMGGVDDKGPTDRVDVFVRAG
jgi:outer membrane protein OmpA-like peptidoglycan-associated protein